MTLTPLDLINVIQSIKFFRQKNLSHIFAVFLQIVDLEDGILQLKEDLILERTEARTEKKKLKKAVVSQDM